MVRTQSIQPFNYAATLKNVEDIKGARLRNQAMGYQNKQAENVIANQQRLDEVRNQHDEVPAQIEALRAMGRHDLADQQASSWLQQKEQTYNVVKGLSKVTTESSWPQLRSDLGQAGLIDFNEMPSHWEGEGGGKQWLEGERKKEKRELKLIKQTYGTPQGPRTQENLYVNGELHKAGAPYDPVATKSGISVSTNKDGTADITFGKGGNSGAPKGAQASLFKEVVGNQQGLDAINQIESIYEPDFLTYGGAVEGKVATWLNKLNPDQRSQFQSRRAAFKSAVGREFLRFRKWATGVAGGEKEMAEIKRVGFSEDDGPQDFEAKIQQARALQRRLNARLKAALHAGVENDVEFKGYIKAHPLEEIPTLQQRVQQLRQMGYKKDAAREILIDEGYQ